MAPSSDIKGDDFILVNRDGVDYKARVSNLPSSGGGGGEEPKECPVYQIQFSEDDTDDNNVIEEHPLFDGWEPYFRMKYDPTFKSNTKIKCRTAPDGEWVERKIISWQHYTHPDLDGEHLNFQVGFDSDDYNGNWNEASLLNCSGIGDADLIILNGRGRQIGEFSANATNDTVLRIPTDSQDYDQDPPRHPCWLHIKNVRGGALKLRYVDSNSPLASVEAIGVGNHVNQSNFLRETKRYMSALMVYGMEPEGGNKSDKCLRLGDFSITGSMTEGFDGDNARGYELLEAAGFNSKNFCGTTSTKNDKDSYFGGATKEWIHIHPVALMKDDNGNWVEVPNHYEYLVYFWPEHALNDPWISADPGTTYELGPLTYTTPKKNWSRFFQDADGDVGNAAPCNGLRYLDVSNGEDFSRMFYRDHLMGDEPDLRFWNVSKGKNFEAMFEECENFNADLSHWDMGNAENISKMFEDCRNFTCGRRESAEHGVGRWRPSKLGTGKKGNDSATWAFYRCERLGADMRNWECPAVEKLDQIRMHTGLRLQNKEYVLGDSHLADDPPEPWDSRSKSNYDHAYYNANAFIQSAITGPDRYKKNQYDQDTYTIVKMGYTKHFNLERKAIWQEYIDWVDDAVKNNILPSWDWRGDVEQREEVYDALKERDDKLIEQHFAPTWGLITMKKEGDDRIVDEGNNLENKPALMWCKPGETAQCKPEWTTEYFVNPDYKGNFRPKDTDYEWTVVDGDATIANADGWKPTFTCNGNLGDVVTIQMKLTMEYWEVEGEESPSETQTILITVADSQPTPP